MPTSRELVIFAFILIICLLIATLFGCASTLPRDDVESHFRDFYATDYPPLVKALQLSVSDGTPFKGLLVHTGRVPGKKGDYFVMAVAIDMAAGRGEISDSREEDATRTRYQNQVRIWKKPKEPRHIAHIEQVFEFFKFLEERNSVTGVRRYIEVIIGGHLPEKKGPICCSFVEPIRVDAKDPRTMVWTKFDLSHGNEHWRTVVDGAFSAAQDSGKFLNLVRKAATL